MGKDKLRRGTIATSHPTFTERLLACLPARLFTCPGFDNDPHAVDSTVYNAAVSFVSISNNRKGSTEYHQ
ncbi:MAG: hypothetical protein E3K32_03585 [wastewater metagenome]|nr:hypothetical protein [Candidatus Loosdrechtia aerotolerans]